jgi:hypothetical protein
VGARTNAVIGVTAALAIAALAIARRDRPVPAAARDTTTAIRIVRRDATGLPEQKATVREAARVRALTEALGIDLHPGGPCPPDYAEADLGLVLSGNDVYAKRNVYVFGLLGDGGVATVVSVTSAGCRIGPPADLAALDRELRAAKILGPAR